MSIKPAAACWIASALAAWVPAAYAVLPGERTGKQVVETFCFECHGTGANAAPSAFGWSSYEAGVCSGVEAVTRHLARHFPAVSGSRNELPDTPVVV